MKQKVFPQEGFPFSTPLNMSSPNRVPRSRCTTGILPAVIKRPAGRDREDVSGWDVPLWRKHLGKAFGALGGFHWCGTARRPGDVRLGGGVGGWVENRTRSPSNWCPFSPVLFWRRVPPTKSTTEKKESLEKKHPEQEFRFTRGGQRNRLYKASFE